MIKILAPKLNHYIYIRGLDSDSELILECCHFNMYPKSIIKDLSLMALNKFYNETNNKFQDIVRLYYYSVIDMKWLYFDSMYNDFITANRKIDILIKDQKGNNLLCLNLNFTERLE